MDTALPTTSLGLKVTFTGLEDLEAHLTAFHTQMMLIEDLMLGTASY